MSTIEVPQAVAARPAVRSLVWLIRTYQAARFGHASPCRFTPTCSHYAIEALEAHGTRRGLVLAAGRLGRCRPGGPNGFDPVPPACAPDDLRSNELSDS